jgi:hypothetical protein
MSDTPRELIPPARPHAWNDWYRFARDELEYGHDERVEYANLRYVEECNRESLRRRAAAYDALSDC